MNRNRHVCTTLHENALCEHQICKYYTFSAVCWPSRPEGRNTSIKIRMAKTTAGEEEVTPHGRVTGTSLVDPGPLHASRARCACALPSIAGRPSTAGRQRLPEYRYC